MIEAKIIADSITSADARLTTYVLTYPRFIHAELMTHRAFSRNASSSRAIPVAKQIQEVIDNPAIPLEFRKNQKGMQAGELLEDQEAAKTIWLEARDQAVYKARKMVAMDIHKQYANRILEPFAHISVIVTATDFANWFALRRHEAAQPEIHTLADVMYEDHKHSSPKRVRDGYWHLPFLTEQDILECADMYGKKCLRDSEDATYTAIQRSVARCARVSYKNHDGSNTTLSKDLELYAKLVIEEPIHASPAEHQAMAIPQANIQSGNFRGWIQFRKTLKNECVHEYQE